LTRPPVAPILGRSTARPSPAHLRRAKVGRLAWRIASAGAVCW